MCFFPPTWWRVWPLFLFFFFCLPLPNTRNLFFSCCSGGAQRQSDGGDGLAAGFEEPVRGWGLSGWVNNDGRKEWWRSSSSSSSTSGWGSGLRQPWLAPGNSDKQVCAFTFFFIASDCDLFLFLFRRRQKNRRDSPPFEGFVTPGTHVSVGVVPGFF